jgi:type II secretory pathway pseudopilin PulG
VNRERGFTYVGLLLAVAIAGAVAAGAGTMWSTQAQREREAQLLFAGEEIARAIGRYRADHGTVGDGFPRDFEALLRDPHVPVMRRYLRRLYVDPMTGSADWGIVRSPAGNIAGVYSRSQARPLRTVLPDTVKVDGRGATHADWRFLAIASGPATPPAAQGAAVGPVANAEEPAVPSPAAPPFMTQAGAAPPRREPERDRCARVAQADAAICGEVRRLYGPNAGDPCTRSAAARAAACESETPIPPLQQYVR